MMRLGLLGFWFFLTSFLAFGWVGFLSNRVFGFVSLVDELFHGSVVLLFDVFAYLFEDVVEVAVLVLIIVFFVHFGDEIDERVLHFSGHIGTDHHNEVSHEFLPIVKVVGGLIIHYPGVVKFAEASEVHRDFIVEAHQFRGFVEVLEVLVVVDDFNEAFDKFAIDVHSVLVEAVVEVVGELLILALSIGRVGEVVLVEGVLENVLGFHHIDWAPAHQISLSIPPLYIYSPDSLCPQHNI